jgi:hypothetical protein
MIYAIGSDPEFVFITHTKKLVPAYNILHSSQALQDTIGLDGHTSTAELRPAYSKSIYAHLNNIVKAKAQIQNLCNTFKVDALAKPLSAGESLGGHIHISTPTRENITQKLMKRGITLQFLALPAAKFFFGEEVYTRFSKSGFKYGSPLDIRSDWGKNHIELRMFPTFLGLNNSNIYALLNYYISGFVYLESHTIHIPEIKSFANIPQSTGFLNSSIEISRNEFNDMVEKIYEFTYKNKIGFVIKFYKSLNKKNSNFFIAKYNTVTTDYMQYSGIVQWLSPKVKSHIIIKHGKPKHFKRGSVHYFYINNRISSENYMSESIAIAKKILGEI